MSQKDESESTGRAVQQVVSSVTAVAPVSSTNVATSMPPTAINTTGRITQNLHKIFISPSMVQSVDGSNIKLVNPRQVQQQIVIRTVPSTTNSNHLSLIQTSASGRTPIGTVVSSGASPITSGTTFQLQDLTSLLSKKANTGSVLSSEATTSSNATAASTTSTASNQMITYTTIGGERVHPSRGTFNDEVPGTCVRCGTIGVRDSFYGKGKQFCSRNCVKDPSQSVQTTQPTPTSATTSIFKICRSGDQEAITLPYSISSHVPSQGNAIKVGGKSGAQPTATLQMASVDTAKTPTYTTIQVSTTGAGGGKLSQTPLQVVTSGTMKTPISALQVNQSGAIKTSGTTVHLATSVGGKPGQAIIVGTDNSPLSATLTTVPGKLSGPRYIIKQSPGLQQQFGKITAKPLVTRTVTTPLVPVTHVILNPSSGTAGTLVQAQSGNLNATTTVTATVATNSNAAKGVKRNYSKVSIPTVSQQQILANNGTTSTTVPVAVTLRTPSQDQSSIVATPPAPKRKRNPPSNGSSAKRGKKNTGTSETNQPTATTNFTLVQTSSSAATLPGGQMIQLKGQIVTPTANHQGKVVSVHPTSILSDRLSRDPNLMQIPSGQPVFVQVPGNSNKFHLLHAGNTTKALANQPVALHQIKTSDSRINILNSSNININRGFTPVESVVTLAKPALPAALPVPPTPAMPPVVAPVAPPPPPPKTTAEEIKLLDQSVLAAVNSNANINNNNKPSSNSVTNHVANNNNASPLNTHSTSSSSSKENYPPGWSLVFDNYGYERCAPVSNFWHIPLASVWKNIIAQDIYFEIEISDSSSNTLHLVNKINHAAVNCNANSTPSKNKNNKKHFNFDLPDQNRKYWFVKVVGHSGYYLRMRYAGLESNASYDFWVNIRVRNLYPIGYAKQAGRQYKPPREVTDDNPLNYRAEVQRLLTNGKTIDSDLHQLFTREFQCEMKPGLRVEVLDKQRCTFYRVATVSHVLGRRAHVRFDGEDQDDPGYWYNFHSEYMRPVGWATLVGHELLASREYAIKSLQKALRNVRHHVRKNHNRVNLNKVGLLKRFERYTKEVRFKEGMKVEVVDPYRLSVITVGTVRKTLRFGFIVLSIDTLDPTEDDPTDWFCLHSSSPYLLPAGFCAAYRIHLTPPKNYPAQRFDWASYMQQMESIIAPADFFSFRDFKHGFEEGMLLEAVDMVEPNLICIAVIKRVVGRLLLLHFVGWEDSFDQWCDCYSPNIYPVGYCDLTDYPLQGPPTKAQAPDKKRKMTFARKRRKTNNSPKGKNFASGGSSEQTPQQNNAFNFDTSSLKTEENTSCDYNDLLSGLSDLMSEDNDDELDRSRDEAHPDGEEEENVNQSEDDEEEDEQDEDELTLERERSEEYNFLSENEVAVNAGFHISFNPLATPLAERVELGNGRYINLGSATDDSIPVEFGTGKIQFEVHYRHDQVRQRLVRRFGEEDANEIAAKRRQFQSAGLLYKPTALDGQVQSIPNWTPYQVAKFLMVNHFDECYDAIVAYQVDGKRFLELHEMHQALKVTLLKSTASKLVQFVRKIRHDLAQAKVENQ